MDYLRKQINVVFYFLLAIAISQSAGVLGSIFSSSAIPNWYSKLITPAGNPPNWVFAPVWITLYTLMGIASYIIWYAFPSPLKGSFKKQKQDRRKALWVFALQLVLNALWSYIFFGLHSPFFSLLEIMILWVFILWTIELFYKVSRASAFLLIPYLLWVTYATYLNFAFWLLN